MTADHYTAVLDLLSDLPVTLYEGQVPATPSYPYAVLYMDTGRGSSRQLCGKTNRDTYNFQVTSVGVTDASVRFVVDAVMSRLKDVRPAVTGFRSNPIEHLASVPVRPDRDVTDPDTNLHPMYAVDTFTFVSTPRG